MSAPEIALAVLTVLLSSAGSAIASTIAHRIHIMWIREALDRHERAITRAHERIDKIERA